MPDIKLNSQVQQRTSRHGNKNNLDFNYTQQYDAKGVSTWTFLNISYTQLFWGGMQVNICIGSFTDNDSSPSLSHKILKENNHLSIFKGNMIPQLCLQQQKMWHNILNC